MQRVTYLLALLLATACLIQTAPNHSGSSIVFVDHFSNHRQPSRRPTPSANRFQHGETSASSEQQSSGNSQTNRGQASGVSVQEQQSGLGGNVQVTNNQALIEAVQHANGGSTGHGTGPSSQESNNQVNIHSSQLQQNVQGTLVNVEEGHQGVVIVNTENTDTGVVSQQLINNRPVAAETVGSSRCRFTCRRNTGQLYCCDDGSDVHRNQLTEEIHGGYCPPARLICPQGGFFARCAHDGHCPASDKCCYDTCARHHICKRPDAVPAARPDAARLHFGR